MPKQKETAKKAEDSVLVSAAKAIGKAAGEVAKLAGAEPEPRARAVSQKIPKLTKKNKTKLPRREKKAAQKRAEGAHLRSTDARPT
jgi:F420-0:gamma-glutamyl ligase